MSTRLSTKTAVAAPSRRVPASVPAPVPPPGKPIRAASPGEWTFLTNHAHVLLCLAADPEQRVRDLAARVGITERAVQKIIAELEGGAVIQRERSGRRNRYTILGNLPLRHPVEAHRTVADLIDAILGSARR